MKKKSFILFLETIPFKYFIIDKNNRCIKYAYPLVKVAISEIINTNKVNKFIGNNQAEREWNMERKVIDFLKTSHVLGDKYIDNYFEITSIFLKYKIENEYFDCTSNSLFYFKFNNLRRYNCAIYLGLEKALLLIKISIKKTEEQLKKYNKNNFQKDIDKMQKFLHINNLIVNDYYLLFILDESNYKCHENYEILEKFNFEYCIFNSEYFEFFNKPNKFYKIEYEVNNYILENQKNIIEFAQKDGNFIYQEIDGLIKFYGEIGMTLEDFIYQVFEESIADDCKQKNQDLFKYKNFTLKSKFFFIYNKYRDYDLEDGKEILFINLKENNIYFGTGRILNGNCILSFRKYNTLLYKVDYDVENFIGMNGLIFTYFKEKESLKRFFKK